MQRWNNFIYYFIFRQVALKALNERLTKAEGQSNWPTLLDDEGKTESTGKEEEKKEETKLPIPPFKENSAEG
jgi:hypothetical protein